MAADFLNKRKNLPKPRALFVRFVYDLCSICVYFAFNVCDLRVNVFEKSVINFDGSLNSF